MSRLARCAAQRP